MAVMTPWRYFAASGPETEIRLREASGATPEGAGPVGVADTEAAGAGAGVEKARRDGDAEEAKHPRQTKGVAALVSVTAVLTGCMALLSAVAQVTTGGRVVCCKDVASPTLEMSVSDVRCAKFTDLPPLSRFSGSQC